jgi:RNA polymerase sigma factor (sigma-70 family)
MSALEAPEPGAEQETARLFAAHSAEILSFCRRQLASSSDAEDALQTTFVYVLRALRRGVVPENESAWLTTIAKNVCHTQRRTLGRRGALSTDLDLERIALAQPEPDEKELLAALPDALATLPESQRNAIVMREWLGLAPGEIATRLELTTPATNALLTRARHSLASALTTAVRGPLSALNIPLLADALRGYLKAVLGSAASKTAVAAVVATASVAGVAVQQTRAGDDAAPATGAIVDRTPPAVVTGSTARVPGLSVTESRPASSHEHGRANGVGTTTVPSARPPVSPTTTARGHVVPPAATAPAGAPGKAGGPVAGDASTAPSPKKSDHVTLPESPPVPEALPLPPLPPLPDLGLDDPLLPPVEAEVPPLEPLPQLPPAELPPLEPPQLPPLPPLP